jgi:hypothetical protein
MAREAPRRRTPRPTGDDELDAMLAAFLAELDPVDQRIALETLGTVLHLSREADVSRLDRKIANTALKEMRHAFNVFAPLRDVRKVTIFGSARTPKGHPEYEAAKRMAKDMAERGWMVITGAGPGIMEAGHEGALAEKSIGVNILLPFEAKPNPVIADDPKLINFKYFFTRKLMFIKESNAFVLLPGGFGTMDETFELLTLTQTGKSDIHPILMLDAPGENYWRQWETYLREALLPRGFIDTDDMHLFRIVDQIPDAIEEIESFYRVYHSIRWVGDQVVMRLTKMPDDALLATLSAEFDDLLIEPLAATEASKGEIRDGDVPELPRIALRYDPAKMGRLRRLIDALNERA